MNTVQFKINFRTMHFKCIAYTVATFCLLALMTRVGYTQSLISNDGYVHLRNQSLYGNNGSILYYNSNQNGVTQFVLRDRDEEIFGKLYGLENSGGKYFGLRDAENDWSYIAKEGDYIQLRIINQSIMALKSTGDVGIGTTGPQARLHLDVEGSDGLRIDGDNTGDVSMLLRNGTVNHYIFSDQSDGNCFDFGSQNNMAFNTGGAYERMRILSTGEVGIGTTTVPTGYLVAINGKAIVEEMRVKPSDFWDEVFEADYDLISIEEKQKFTETNKHLPSFAPESEIVDEGMDVGKSFADVAKELEEAYLYIYQLNDKVKDLEKQLNDKDDLQKQLNELKAQFAKLSEQSDK